MFTELERKLANAVVVIDKFYANKCSKNGRVEGRSDWKMIEYLYELFRIAYPEEARIFIESQKQVQRHLKTDTGKTSEDANESMRHLINMPQKFYQTIKLYYPKQKWDKKFVLQLCRRMPILSVPTRL